ncbi:MAG: Ig-like domain-containing protein, partial [Xenococcaceae cyanobacterium MO_167.B52]|nr:Ig-like domain-containing protein [Xenococcaceae cyanobacterium MO_167.B52]
MTLENIAGEFKPTETTWTDDSSSGGLDDSSSGGSSNKSPVYKNLPIDGKISVMENTTHVIDIDATDDYDSEGNGLKYFIVGGADKNLYTIDQHTGKLSFINPPDFENPLDAHKNNIYDVIVRVVDSHGAYNDQSLWIHVTDKPDGNRDPIAMNDTATTKVGEQVGIEVLDNDYDPDGDQVQIKFSATDKVSAKGGTIKWNRNNTPDNFADDRLI